MTSSNTTYNDREPRVAVVIPAYKVKRHILSVVSNIPEMVWRIYVVDDACPEGSGHFLDKNIQSSRIKLIYHESNQGVGGAVMTGYQSAILDGADIIVKIDGDNQMNPSLIPYFIEPILKGEADYTKGNRFYNLEKIREMPSIRLFGNAMLSFMNKLSSGYWDLFDPTNGYTAIHAKVAMHLPIEKISHRYFFESDMLFRLNTLRAVIIDIPMDAKYGDETSNLKITKIASEFFYKHTRNLFKRIFYNYYLRDLSLASFELPIGLSMFFFGLAFGGYNWIASSQLNQVTPAGTVMLAAMPTLMGLQLILAFIGYDISSIPNRPLHPRLTNANDFKKNNPE